MGDAILVENLGKHFNRYHTEKPVTIMEAALIGLRRIKPVDHFWALRGVSFEVAAGEMLGVIGHNGAGKSTLLQLLGKVAHPTEGRIKMRGHIGALLDLGAGFHGDLTGQENVFVTAIVAGLTRREVAHRFDRIVAFAELEDFIHNPVRTYSSGMMMRLAFSVAVHTEPDILLVDEFLSVGDLSFQTKCLKRITEMKEQGCAIVLVSHDVSQVERLCDRALWLKHGTVMAYGKPTVVAGQYRTQMQTQTQQCTPHSPPQFTGSGTELRVNENRFGSLEAEITDVRLLPINVIQSGDPLSIEIDYITQNQIEFPIFIMTMSCEDGQICFEANTERWGLDIHRLKEKGTLKIHLKRLDLVGGQYFVSVGIFERNWSFAYDYHWHAYDLHVNSNINLSTRTTDKGILNPPLTYELSVKPP